MKMASRYRTSQSTLAGQLKELTTMGLLTYDAMPTHAHREVTSRRSSRLNSTGYYNSEGQPCITYKETLYRIFRRHRRNPWIGTWENTSNDDSNEDSNKDSNHRASTVFTVRIFGFLFFILPLCLGFAYLIPTLGSNFLDSGPPESHTPNPTNRVLNTTCEERANLLAELQDELLRLKHKINYLLPVGDTLPNFALDSLGAYVVSHLSSVTYEPEANCFFFGIPIWKSPVNPSIVIKVYSPLDVGRCWPFAGGHGHLLITLAYPVNISHVTLAHISKNMSPTGSIPSAPKQFSVFGMKSLGDGGTQLGTFLYDQDGDTVQTFKMPDHKQVAFSYVKLQVESNWGHPDFTCLYNFRVHGKLA